MTKNLFIICGCLMFGTSLLMHGMQFSQDDFKAIITKELKELYEGFKNMAPDMEEMDRAVSRLVEHHRQSPFLRGGQPDSDVQQTEVTDPQTKKSWLPVTLCTIGISSIIMLFLAKKLYNKMKAYRAKKALPA